MLETLLLADVDVIQVRRHIEIIPLQRRGERLPLRRRGMKDLQQQVLSGRVLRLRRLALFL